MSRIVRNIIVIVGAVVVAACLAASYVAGVSLRKPLTCKGLSITITDSECNSFVSKEDVTKYLDKEYGQYIDIVLDSLDLDRVERILKEKSAINTTEAYVTKDGMLNIKVTQRKPAVRFQGTDGGYYADADGRTFPLQKSYASHVPVVDGNIPKMTDTVKVVQTTALVNFLENSPVWKGKFVQIRIDSKGDIILVPRKGQERFIIGQPYGIKEKAERMEMYYTHIIPAKGSGYYKTIDLRFDGQIVCR